MVLNVSNLPRKLKVTCPKCHGFKAIAGVTDGLYRAPATLPCPRCLNSSGEVWEDSLTEEEKNQKPKPFYERDDNP